MSSMLLPVAGSPSSTQDFIDNNPMWRVAQVMMGLNNAQGELLNSMKLQVIALTQNMTEVNNVLKTLYKAQENDAIGDKTSKFNVATSEGFLYLPYSPDDTPASYLARVDKANAQREALIKMAQTIVDYGAAPSAAYDDTQPTFTVGNIEIGNKQLPSPPAPANTYVYTASATSANIDSMTQGMQRAVDDLSARVQQAQLDLQTMMGRYNGAFEVVTAAIKKVETRSQAAIMNFGR